MGSAKATQLVVLLFFLVVTLGSNFILGQTFSSNTFEPGTNVSQPMAMSHDTARVDPLAGFKKYRGGYDITNNHYWSSTAFTGVYGYVIGLLWLLAGVVYGGYLLATIYCCKNGRDGKLRTGRLPCHKQCYQWPVLLVVIFTILAITASGLVLGGNEKFHSQAKTVLNIIINTANNASETIYETTGAMDEIKHNLEATNESATAQASGFLTSTSERLDDGATDVQRQASKNRRLINKGLKIVYIATTVTVSLNLVAVFALSVCGILRIRRALHLLIVLCWFLTVLCWLIFGVYFFLGNFSSDTCTALENFEQNPYNNSLSSILPCDKLLPAKLVLSEVSADIYSLVNEVNANISESYPNLMKVCNPFSAPPEYTYQADNCPTNTIPIEHIPEVLKYFTCSSESCGDGQFISASDYQTVEALASSIQILLNAYPEMESLVECQPVKDAFAQILSRHCKPLKKYVFMVWISMVLLSMSMVLLVLIWTMQARHEREHHSLDGSVKSHSTTPDVVECAADEAAKDSSKHISV